MNLDIEQKIAILNFYGFGIDAISKILDVSRKLVKETVTKKYEFEKKKERLHRTLNENLILNYS